MNQKGHQLGSRVRFHKLWHPKGSGVVVSKPFLSYFDEKLGKYKQVQSRNLLPKKPKYPNMEYDYLVEIDCGSYKIERAFKEEQLSAI